jgi:hypothetical protein
MAYPFSTIESATEIREIIYQSFDSRNDLSMELLDSLSAETKVSSPVELSLSHHFTRQFSSISQLISQILVGDSLRLMLKDIGSKVEVQIKGLKNTDKHILFFALDETGIFKPCANAMEDRGHVHGYSKTHGAIGVGHSYSYLVGIHPLIGQWVVPIDITRVKTGDSAITIGMEQFSSHVKQSDQNDTYVLTADSKYSTVKAVDDVYKVGDHALLLTRLNSVRNLSFSYKGSQMADGANKLYGDDFKLHKDSTWCDCHDEDSFTIESKRGKTYNVKLRRWNNLIMAGKDGIKMHERHFDIVKVDITNQDGSPVYHKSMWLMLAGARRSILNMKEIFEGYASRFKIEHFFRFSKQHLLLGKYQTPDTETQNKWCQFSALAYLNLMSCSGLINGSELYPWQKAMKQTTKLGSPYQTKRAFSNIIDKIGTPAKPCEYAAHGNGRKSGVKLSKRGKAEVIKKSKKVINVESEIKPKNSHPKKIEFPSQEALIEKLKLSKKQIALLEKAA